MPICCEPESVLDSEAAEREQIDLRFGISLFQIYSLQGFAPAADNEL